jgi:hypothetical protein
LLPLHLDSIFHLFDAFPIDDNLLTTLISAVLAARSSKSKAVSHQTNKTGDPRKAKGVDTLRASEEASRRAPPEEDDELVELDFEQFQEQQLQASVL